jgi:multiple sugar transport system substrate-binding protein
MHRSTRLTLATLVTLAASALVPVHAETTVRLWTLLSGGDGVRMKQLVDGFNASQNEVHVETTTLKWGEPFYTKLKTASAVGDGPDLATVHLSRLAGLASEGVLRPITSTELAASGLNGGDFYPRLWAKANTEGKLYAVPLDTHALVLYYNKDLIKKAGLADASGDLKPISGIDALTAAFSSVKQKTGMPGMTMESAPDSYMPWRLWETMVYQRGGRVIDHGKLVYGDNGKVALTTIADWYAKGYATRNLDYAASTTEFMSGKAGFMINGVWEVPTVVDQSAGHKLGFDYGVVPLPPLYGNGDAVWADSHAFAIPANKGQAVSPERVRAALEFVAYVEKHAIGWAKGGHIPAYKPVTESADFTQLKPNADFAQAVATRVAYDPDGWYSGAAGPLEAASAKYFPAALSGQLPVDRALQMFDSDADKLLRAPAR